jgi:hypothetical protein
MGTTYLSSRVEVLRALYVDTGRKMALIGVPGEFRDWIDKALPENVSYMNDQQALSDGSEYDIIVMWVPGGSEPDPVLLLEHLDHNGDLWLVLPTRDKVGRRILDRFEPRTIRGHPTLPLTFERELVPVWIRSRDYSIR